MTSRERLLQRRQSIAVVATADHRPSQVDDMRVLTRTFLNTMGLVRAEMVLGCYGQTEVLTRETVRMAMEEQIAIAQQAIDAAAFLIRAVRGAAAAEAYHRAALAEIDAVRREDPAASFATNMAVLAQRMAEGVPDTRAPDDSNVN
jgi:hypothetical protein